MKLKTREVTTFAIFAAMIYASQTVMSIIPNVHVTAMLIAVLTILYRWKALYSVFAYVFLFGALNGFPLWWLPYLYIWPLLVAAVNTYMKFSYINQIPLKVSQINRIAIMIINGLHGLLYGTLYAILYAPMTGMNFQETITWIIAGLPFDIIHGISNFIIAWLVFPVASIIYDCMNNFVKD